MEEVLRFAMIGIGLGAMYSLASQGLVLIYRGSGVLNFAIGAIGMVGAYGYHELRTTLGLPFLVAMLGGIAISMTIGALCQFLIMKRLKKASPLTRVVATLGILLILQSIAVLRYGGRATFVPSELPLTVIQIYGKIVLPVDRLIMLVVAAVLTLVLWLVYRKTRFGLGTSAAAENEVAAASLGWSADRIATINWALGSGLAGLAGILIAPIVTLQVSVMTNLVLAAMAAALVAGFRSFPITFFAGLALGVGQTVLGRFTGDTPGLALSLPFAVIVLMLVIRGQSLPMRDFLLQRLPLIGDGRVRARTVLIAVAGGVLLILLVTPLWQDAVSITCAIAMVILSIVVVTGYAGQLSLAQFALAGFGAWVAGRIVAMWGVPFPLAFLIGVLAGVPMGMLFALPAVRTRGISLAVATLGLGTAIEYMIFANGALTGGVSGTTVGEPTVFGLNINSAGYPERYALVCLLCLAVGLVLVGNVRRGRSGRRLIAVRTNERAAAALGIGVPAAKVYAFGLAGGLAAAGGILLGFMNTQIQFSTTFANFNSISAVGWAMIGGIGYLLGPIFGATLAPGSVGAALLDSIPGGISRYLPLISGVLLVLFALQNQDGMAKEMSLMGRQLLSRIRRSKPVAASPAEATSGADPATGRQAVQSRPKVLTVDGVSVRYGGTTAVDAVSLRVEPGRIVGLIGPNGAGKTSLIDAITGFTPVATGTVRLDDLDIQRTSAAGRARLGLSRSFQSLELFEDSSVRDNLQTAADPRDLRSYFGDLVHPVNPGLSPAALAAVQEFGLEADLDRRAQDLPYGRRRLLALARAVATQPSVLLLDEPAAGLGDAETAELSALLRRLAVDWNIGILLVEHDMNLVMAVCDDIVVLDFGKKIAAGPPAEIRRDPVVLNAYLGESPEELDLDTTISGSAS